MRVEETKQNKKYRLTYTLPNGKKCEGIVRATHEKGYWEWHGPIVTLSIVNDGDLAPGPLPPSYDLEEL